jgi:hypothetical protein
MRNFPVATTPGNPLLLDGAEAAEQYFIRLDFYIASLSMARALRALRNPKRIEGRRVWWDATHS